MTELGSNLFNGEPVFTTNEAGEFSTVGIVDIESNCIGTDCLQPLTEAEITFVNNQISTMPTQTLPEIPIFNQDCSVASWTDQPIWASAQGIALMIVVPIATSILGGIVGAIAGYGCHKPPTKITQTQMNKLR